MPAEPRDPVKRRDAVPGDALFGAVIGQAGDRRTAIAALRFRTETVEDLLRPFLALCRRHELVDEPGMIGRVVRCRGAVEIALLVADDAARRKPALRSLLGPDIAAEDEIARLVPQLVAARCEPEEHTDPVPAARRRAVERAVGPEEQRGEGRPFAVLALVL